MGARCAHAVWKPPSLAYQVAANSMSLVVLDHQVPDAPQVCLTRTKEDVVHRGEDFAAAGGPH